MQYEITKDEFEKKYDSFLDKLFYKEEGSFHKLLTKNNKEFGVLRNQNSIYIKALTDKQSEMTISKKQLMNVVINDKNYNLVSYEPVLIDYIINNKLNSNEQYKYDDYNNDEVRNMFNSDNHVSEQKLEPRSKNKIKNIILYGSPGVGKTHNTKKLISLIESGLSEKKIFETIKNNELNDVVGIDNVKDRVKFITFHQSFGYEDFIEGFRPNEEGNIELEDGVFKSICNDFAGIMKLTEHFSINREIHSERSTYIIDGITNDLIKIKKENGDKIVPIPIRLVMELLEYIQSSDLTLDDIKYRNLDQVQMSFDKYMYGYNSILYAVCKSVVEEERIGEQKNYYLVIDEINRGNISKIFGELITLIEEDKRDTLEVTLPYSKKPFKIPSNLYIIGTMNSTDKSIALIDIALRRRFTFLKMEPNIELVDYVKAKNIMKQLNEKITETLGADYVLGHSYFMKIENDDALEFVLEYKIKPLLEEYFYGDSEGLKQILEMIDE